MRTKFTPGPWEVSGEIGSIEIKAFVTDTRSSVYIHIDNGWEEDLPNANLISAAPDLYESCSEMTRVLSSLVRSMCEELDTDTLTRVLLGADERINGFGVRSKTAMTKARGEA